MDTHRAFPHTSGAVPAAIADGPRTRSGASPLDSGGPFLGPVRETDWLRRLIERLIGAGAQGEPRQMGSRTGTAVRLMTVPPRRPGRAPPPSSPDSCNLRHIILSEDVISQMKSEVYDPIGWKLLDATLSLW